MISIGPAGGVEVPLSAPPPGTPTDEFLIRGRGPGPRYRQNPTWAVSPRIGMVIVLGSTEPVNRLIFNHSLLSLVFLDV